MKRMMKVLAVISGFGLLLFGQSVIAAGTSQSTEGYSTQEAGQEEVQSMEQQGQGMQGQGMQGHEMQGQGMQGHGMQGHGTQISDLRREDVMGQRVQDRSGGEMGTISEAITDENDQISYIILTRAEDNALVPVPLYLIQNQGTPDSMLLVVDLEKDQMKDAPTVSQEEMRDFDQQEVRGYYEDMKKQ